MTPTVKRKLSAFGLAALLGGSVACAVAVTGSKQATPTKKSPAQLVVFASSDMRGYLAPCGCSENMRGGIARAGEQILASRKSGTPTLYVDSGDSLFRAVKLNEEVVPQEERKAKALAQAMKTMGLFARTSGERDTARGPDFTRELDLPELLPGEMKLTAMGERQVGIAAGSDAKSLKAAAKAARDAGARFVFGLFHGTVAQARAVIAEEEGARVDFLVASHAESELGGEDNKLLRGAVPIAQVQNKGRSLLRVDVWFAEAPGPFALLSNEADAQRELNALDQRIELLNKQINLPGLEGQAKGLRQDKLVELIARRETLAQREAPSGEGQNALSVRFIPLEATLSSAPEVTAVVKAYDKDVGFLNLAYAKAHGRDCPPPEKGKSGFVGNAPCKECHEEAFPIWETSKHAHGYETLQAAEKQFHLDCIGCHVIGYQQPGGVCRIDRVEGRKGVGCESCHGPGSLHSEDPAVENIAKGNTLQACVGCHDAENSPHFNFESYTKQILGPGHGAPTAAR